MRLKEDGSLDYRPAPRPELSKPWTLMTDEEQRQHMIDEMLHNHPAMTPERAAELVDALF